MPESTDEKNPEGFFVFLGERFEPRGTEPSAAGGGQRDAAPNAAKKWRMLERKKSAPGVSIKIEPAGRESSEAEVQ